MLTCSSTNLDHKIPYWGWECWGGWWGVWGLEASGVTSEKWRCLSSGQLDPSQYWLLATRCLYWGISELRSTGPLAYQGGQQGCRGHGGVTSEKWRQSIAEYSVKLKMVCWTLQTIEHEFRSMEPKFVPLLATRCLYLGVSRSTGVMGWGYIWQNIILAHRLMKCHADLQ